MFYAAYRLCNSQFSKTYVQLLHGFGTKREKCYCSQFLYTEGTKISSMREQE